jgi:hypothetical protein
MQSMQMQFIALTAVLVVSLGLGCGATSGTGTNSSKDNSNSKDENTTIDGLIKVESEGPGDLYLRKDHGIGGYDAIAIAPSFVNYKRTSARLDPDDEDLYLVSLEQSLIDIAEAAHVPIVNTAGECVVKVGAGFVNVDLARSDSAKVLGRMTLIIEYQDSVSGQSLLRSVSNQMIKREADGTSREQQIADNFDRMTQEVDVISALVAATRVPSPPRAGCEGTLVKARASAVPR